MNALTTLFPVFFMLFLGFISHKRNWITPLQKEGANSIVFHILFPILVFNILFTSHIEASMIYIVGYVFIAFIIAFIIGKLTQQYTTPQYSHFSSYLLTTVEGGNVALPLYISIVGATYATNTVIFDLAGCLMAFILIPILVSRHTNQNTSIKELCKQIFSNSFLIAVIIALILNFTGFYNWLSQSQYIQLYTQTINMITQPIMGMILFIIGYDLTINTNFIKPLIKLLLLRLLIYVGIILGFFIFFPQLMQDQAFMIAVILYFMCPTGFAIPMLVSPLYQNEDDSSFASAYISLFMIITLCIYSYIVIFLV